MTDPIRKATRGFLDWDELAFIVGLILFLALIKGEGVDPQSSCASQGNLQAGNERQLSPHEQDNTPTPAMAPVRWNEERYSL